MDIRYCGRLWDNIHLACKTYIPKGVGKVFNVWAGIKWIPIPWDVSHQSFCAALETQCVLPALLFVTAGVLILGAELPFPFHNQGKRNSPHFEAKSPVCHCQSASRVLVLWLKTLLLSNSKVLTRSSIQFHHHQEIPSHHFPKKIEQISPGFSPQPSSYPCRCLFAQPTGFSYLSGRNRTFFS